MFYFVVDIITHSLSTNVEIKAWMAYWRLSEIAYRAYSVIQKLNLYERIREKTSMANHDKLELSLINSWQEKYMEVICEYSKKSKRYKI